MDRNEVSVNINHHGVVVDNNKMKCNYCEKVMSHSQRLKSHLAGIGGDVTPCEKVPSDVKEVFVNDLLEKSKTHLSQEVRNLDYSNISFCKRRRCHQQSDTRGVKAEQEHQSPTSLQSAAVECSEAPSRLERAQKIIARFIYELGIDLNPVNLYNAKNMIDSIFGSDQIDNSIIMPSYSMLVGRLLQDEVKQTHQYVDKIKDSWRNTGCSILLDGWIDTNGRNLVNILVECPQGPIYLRSADISVGTDGNINALESCLDEVIADIGAENIIQIITYTVSPNMKAVGEKLMEKYQNIFWTVSASHCIELILEKMQKMDMINNVLIKARTVIKFIYNCVDLLKLMRTHIYAHNLVKSSGSKFAECFLTLENIVSEEENLKRMFKSSEWMASFWASRTKGKEVADMVADESFWEDARIVSRGTFPMLRVLELINEKDKIMVCTIYETMDQVKETIKNEFFGQESQYMQFWSIIDEIWDEYLHSPLHSAGYFLNPSLFYSTDFVSDEEVTSGLTCCMERMEKFESVHNAISKQLEEYQHSKGGFGEGSSYDRYTNISPAEWWSTYGGECPDLQKLAVRILSQTCNGASKYQLQRKLPEKMPPQGNICLREKVEQKLLTDLTFVHYNRGLHNVISSMSSSRGNVLAHELCALKHHWLAEMEGGDV